MVFQGTAIPNLIIEVAGTMICIFALVTIWYSSTKNSEVKRHMTAAFSAMLLIFLRFSD